MDCSKYKEFTIINITHKKYLRISVVLILYYSISECAITSSLMNVSLESPQCCKNGNFRTIQCHRGQCRCVDSDGRQIGKENTDVTRLSCYTNNWRNC